MENFVYDVDTNLQTSSSIHNHEKNGKNYTSRKVFVNSLDACLYTNCRKLTEHYVHIINTC